MDDIITNLENRQRELTAALANTDDEVVKLELLTQLLNVDERLARID